MTRDKHIGAVLWILTSVSSTMILSSITFFKEIDKIVLGCTERRWYGPFRWARPWPGLANPGCFRFKLRSFLKHRQVTSHSSADGGHPFFPYSSVLHPSWVSCSSIIRSYGKLEQQNKELSIHMQHMKRYRHGELWNKRTCVWCGYIKNYIWI